MSITDREAEIILSELKNDLGTQQAVADHLGVNKGLVSMVINHARHSPTVREALGLCPITIAVTLENVEAIEISESALAYIVNRFKLAPCPVCENKFYRLGNTSYCHQHNSSSRWYRSKAGREWRKARE